MKDIVCTAALIAAANLELQEASSPAENWAADVFPFQGQHLLCLIHLPTQYCLLIGPFNKAELHDVRGHFKDALWGALHTDGFESYLIDNIVAMFDGMETWKRELAPEQQSLFDAIRKGFDIYAKEAGDNLDLDEFTVQVRHARGPGLAAVTPRDTFGLWAECIPGDD